MFCWKTECLKLPAYFLEESVLNESSEKKKKEIEKYIIGSRKKTALSSEWVWCLGWKIDMGEPVCQGSQFTQRPLCKRLLYPEQVAKEGCRRTCLFYLYSCLSPCASHYVKTEDDGKYLLGLREAQRSPWWLGRNVWLLTDRDTISTRNIVASEGTFEAQQILDLNFSLSCNVVCREERLPG